MDTAAKEAALAKRLAQRYTCVICEKEFQGYGNNPRPVHSSGECCDECNAAVVVPQDGQTAPEPTREKCRCGKEVSRTEPKVHADGSWRGDGCYGFGQDAAKKFAGGGDGPPQAVRFTICAAHLGVSVAKTMVA